MVNIIEKRNYTVYLHTSPSGKYYVGITKQEPNRRWRNGKGYTKNKYFYRAIEKYGWDNINHEIVASNLTKEEAENFEIKLISELHSNEKDFGYNIANGGNSNKGFSHTEEWKEQHSHYMQGENNPMYGKTHSEEVKEKIRNINKGNTYRLGKGLSSETKNKIGEANTGAKNGSAKRVICENMEFGCIKDCAIYYNINPNTMRDWLKGKRGMRKDFIEKGLRYKERGDING